MRAQIVTRCEVYMSAEEQGMLNKVTKWIEDMGDNIEQMPEGIQDILNNIYDEIQHLVALIPDEH